MKKRYLGLLVIILLLGTSCGVLSQSKEMLPLDGVVLQQASTELLGENMHSNMRAFEYVDDRLHMLLTTNVDPSKGAGQGLYYWTKSLDGTWEKHEFLLDKTLSMANIVRDDIYTDDLFFIYSDRTNESFRYAKMVRFDGTNIREVFSIDQTQGQVLNPLAISSQDGYIHIFVPNRTSSAGDVRWWRMNIETEEIEEFDAIELPGNGARMYDLRYEPGRILAPIALNQELHFGVIDTNTLTIETQLLDRFKSPDGMAPRSFNLFKYEDLGVYLLTYLRPASFSNRPNTGLTGEVVARVLDGNTFKTVSETVIGGHTAQTAVTHYMKSEQLNENMFVVAFTSVDRVHQFHLTSRHDNYVSSHLDVWALDENGKLTLVSKNVVTEDTRWDQVLTRIDDHSFLFSFNETTSSNEKWIYEMVLEFE